MKIIQYEWISWIVEKSDKDKYYASPIYNNWKYEMRRAGANWCYNAVEWHNFTKNQLEEIKQSIRKFLEFCKKMKAYEEIKTFEKILWQQ